MIFYLFYLVHLLTALVSSRCFNPGPAFPPPNLKPNNPILRHVLKQLDNTLSRGHNFPETESQPNTSYAISITSPTQNLYTHHHLGQHAKTSANIKTVNSDSVFRIGSISKVLTVLGLLKQEEAGRLNLQDPITNFVPELAVSEDESSKADAPRWSDITLAYLSSQLSGLSRESPRSTPMWDLSFLLSDPVAMGFPPIEKEERPTCDPENRDSASPKPCSRKGT